MHDDDREIAQVFAISALNSIERTEGITHVGRTILYELLAAGELQAVKVGRRTLVTGESILRFIKTRPRANFSTGLKDYSPT